LFALDLIALRGLSHDLAETDDIALPISTNKQQISVSIRLVLVIQTTQRSCPILQLGSFMTTPINLPNKTDKASELFFLSSLNKIALGVQVF